MGNLSQQYAMWYFGDRMDSIQGRTFSVIPLAFVLEESSDVKPHLQQTWGFTW